MATNVTSNASNFTDAMQTGVDPRTGQFFMNFSLLSAQAHALLGPVVDLGLNFSSLSESNHFGLGKGVSLGGVSWFDQKTHQLRLSSGESWSVTGGGQIESRRLKDCVFEHNGTAGIDHIGPRRAEELRMLISWEQTQRNINSDMRAGYEYTLSRYRDKLRKIPFGMQHALNPKFVNLRANIRADINQIKGLSESIDRSDVSLYWLRRELNELDELAGPNR